MNPLLRLVLPALCASVCLAQEPLGQPIWDQVVPDIVSDLTRGRLTMVDVGGTTWEWDGGGWRIMARGLGRQPRHLVHDSTRGRTIMATFDPVSTNRVLLEWDGHSWRSMNVTFLFNPGPMAYDVGRDRVVLLDNSYLYEFDGTSWTYVGLAPQLMIDARLVYDWGMQRMLLLSRPNSYLAPLETRWWDGTNLQLLATGGPAIGYGGVAYDFSSARVVAHGGGDLFTSSNDTWEWNGAQWTQAAAATAYTRHYHQLAFDPQRGGLVGFGGVVGMADSVHDAWAWNGVAWQQIVTAASPPARRDRAIAYDAGRDRGVLYGGRAPFAGSLTDELWEFDGTRWWQLATPAPGPGAREQHAMAPGPNGDVLLFGGLDSTTQSLGDLWRWDGTSWTLVTTTGPSPRARASMALDAVRSRVVMHGGLDQSQPLGDTWEWDGVMWTNPAVNGPRSNTGSALTWDPIGASLVFYGNAGGTGLWRWSGQAWSQIAPVIPNATFGIGFDPDVGQVFVLTQGPFGGTRVPYYWTGSAWMPGPAGRELLIEMFDSDAVAIAPDTLRGRLLLDTGSFALRWGGLAASTEDVGAACSDPAVRTPFVSSFGTPRLGDSAHVLDLRGEALRTGVIGFALATSTLSFGPGCDWQVGGAATRLVLTDQNGNGSAPLPIPNDRGLLGVTVFTQLATLEPAAARGFVFSAPVRLTIGD